VTKESKIQIARRYATALYSAAEESGRVRKVKDNTALLLGIIKSDSSIVDGLSNPLLPASAKKEALAQIAAKLKLEKETSRCFEVVVDNNRTKDIGLILEAFQNVYLQKHNIVSVQVGTAKALSAAQAKKLKAKLEKKLDSEVIIEYNIDPEVLGGLVIEYGSNLIDDSLRGKLNKLSSIMKGA